jgi:hypothetical protein
MSREMKQCFIEDRAMKGSEIDLDVSFRVLFTEEAIAVRCVPEAPFPQNAGVAT